MTNLNRVLAALETLQGMGNMHSLLQSVTSTEPFQHDWLELATQDDDRDHFYDDPPSRRGTIAAFWATASRRLSSLSAARLLTL